MSSLFGIPVPGTPADLAPTNYRATVTNRANVSGEFVIATAHLPAGSYKAGDTIRMRCPIRFACNEGTITTAFAIRIGTTQLVTSLPTNIANSANPRRGILEAEIYLVSLTVQETAFELRGTTAVTGGTPWANDAGSAYPNGRTSNIPGAVDLSAQAAIDVNFTVAWSGIGTTLSVTPSQAAFAQVERF